MCGRSHAFMNVVGLCARVSCVCARCSRRTSHSATLRPQVDHHWQAVSGHVIVTQACTCTLPRTHTQTQLQSPREHAPPPHTHEGKDEPLVPICARPCHCDSPSDGTRAHAALALAVSIRKPRPGQGALRSCARGRQRKPWQCRTRKARVKWGYSPQGPRQYNPHYPTKPKNRAEPSRAEQRRAQQSRAEQ